MSRRLDVPGASGISVAGVNAVQGKKVTLTACEAAAYRLDYDAAVMVAGAAGVNFSEVVWGQQSQEDLGMRPVDEGRFRDIVWNQYVENRIIARMQESDAQDPRKVATMVLSSVQDFHNEMKKFVHKSMTPIVRATSLEVLNGLHFSINQRGSFLCEESDKLDMCRFLMRWTMTNRNFNILVGSMLRKNLLLQDGSMSTLRRTNEVNGAVSRNNVRMKQFLVENLSEIVRQFGLAEQCSNPDSTHETGCGCELRVDWEDKYQTVRHHLEVDPPGPVKTSTFEWIGQGEYSLRPVNASDRKRDTDDANGERGDDEGVAPKKRSVYAGRSGLA